MGKIQNDAIIEKAFANAIRKSENGIINGMVAVLNRAVELCLEKHDAKHQAHIEMGDTYGWIIFYNGVEIKRRIYGEGTKGKAQASMSLNNLMRQPEGYVGVVVASMQPAKYFATRYEFWVMRRAQEELTSENFSQYFKAI